MKRQFQTVFLREVRCDSHAPGGRSGDLRVYRVQGSLLHVKLHRELGGWIATCPELCHDVGSYGNTRNEALRDIGTSICGILSYAHMNDGSLCPGPRGWNKGILESEMKHCFDWGKWREHFHPYFKSADE